MATMQIKHIPEDVHAEFTRRARAAGKSLQEYMLGRLVQEAQEPDLDTIFDQVRRRRGGNFSAETVVNLIREDRDER